MKYFTMDRWADEDGDGQAAFDDYHRYLDSVGDSLPTDLRNLSADMVLHDARLRLLALANGTLELHLDGCEYDEPSQSSLGWQFCLKYSGVRSIASTANPQVGLPGPHGYGDLGYDEVEIIEPGVYEHRLLFSTGIELQTRFTEFSFRRENG